MPLGTVKSRVRRGLLRLKSLLADALLTGTGGESQKPASTDKPPFKLGASGRDDEILIENGLVDLSVFNLPDEMHVRNTNFPIADVEAYGLLKLGDGKSFYDPRSNLQWRPAADGRGYIGTRPPADFDPGVLPQPEPPPAQLPADAVKEPPARAFPIFDESTGQGSIILQHLPNPAEGKAYQLWFSDPQLSEPFSPGLLPPVEGGNGRVFFDLGKTGYAPSGCFLTEEPAGGSAKPTGKILLQGP